MRCELDPVVPRLLRLQLMVFIVISWWVWSALFGGCGLPLIFVSESWSL